MVVFKAMTGKLYGLLALLGPVLFALLVAVKLKHSSASINGRAENIASKLETMASILLPIIVLNAVRRTEISAQLWLTFIIGFALPILVYFIIFLVAKLPMAIKIFSNDGPTNHLLLSSFGGGSRGNLLILTAFGSHVALGSDVIKHFVVLDMGNLICLLSVGFFLLGRIAITREQPYFKEIIEKLFKNPGTYAVLLVFLQLPIFRDTKLASIIASLDPFFSIASPFIGMFFSFFIFLSIFIRLEKYSEVLDGAKDVIIFFCFSRGITAIGIAVFLVVLRSPVELLIASVILVLMPPSSFLWARISQISEAIPAPSIQKAIYLVPNFLYFGMLFIAFLLELI